jgi:autotransporter-associated beta strand protein
MAKVHRQNKRRNGAVRTGLLAVSAAVAGVAGLPGLITPQTARGDITSSNPFSNFAAPKIVASNSTGIGYSSDGTSFELTNGGGSEAVLGLYSTPQTITSFDASFVITATGSADGGTFVIDGSPSAISGSNTNVVGAGGGSGGYDSNATTVPNSFALQWEFYTGNSSIAGSRTTTATNGSEGTLQYWNSSYGSPYINDQGSGVPSINSGDPIQFNLEYFGTTLLMDAFDLTKHTAVQQVFTGVNLPSIVGGNSAYVGFSGGTGGAASTQKISNFTFVANKTYNPIQITTTATTGFNAYGIVPANSSNPAITATQDNGEAGGGYVWYEKGQNTASPSTGLPTSGSLFTSQTDTSHVFQMQSYASAANGGNGYGDVIVLSSSSRPTGGPSSVVIPFTNQAQPYNALSFLTASGNGPNVVSMQINYSNGTTSTGLQFASPDWFSGVGAWDAMGRANTTNGFTQNGYDSVGSTNPNLYEEDVLVPNNSVPISEVILTFAGGNRNPTGNVFVFAVSGEAGAAGPIITYTGVSTGSPNSTWNTLNYNFNGTSGSIVEPVQYAYGDQVFFDDTSATSSHNVTLGAANLNASSWNVNTSTGYSFSGSGMNGSGGLYINTTGGTGLVVLNNSNTYTGGTVVGGGTLKLNGSSSIFSSSISVLAGGTISVGPSALFTGSAISISDSGVLDYNGATLSLGSLLVGSGGVFNVSAGTAVSTATPISITDFGTINWNAANLSLGSLTLGAGAVLNLSANTNVITNSVTINDGGTLNWASPNLSLGSLTVTSGGVFSVGSGTSVANVAATINDSGTIYWNANNLSLGSLTVNSGGAFYFGSNTVLSGSSIAFNDSGTINYSGASLSLASLSGSGILNLTGTSTALTISSSTFTGTIAGTAGSVTFNGSGGTFGGVINDGTVSPISVYVNLNSSTSTLAFNGVNTYSGGTYLVSGIAQVGVSGALGSGPIYFNGGSIGGSSASLASAPATITNTFVYNQSTGLMFDAANPAIFTGGGTIALGAGVTPITVTTHDGTSSNLQIAANFTDPAGGSASLNLTGDFALTGSNSYTGGTTLNGATDVAASSSNAFGTGIINFNGGGIGTLASASGVTFSNPFQTSGAAYFENYNSFTMSGPGFLGSGATYNSATGSFTGGNAGAGAISVYVPSVTFSGVISGGALILQSGSNVLELSGSSNTFTGPIVLQGTSGTNQGGTLQIDNPGAIAGVTNAAGGINVSGGATLLINDNSGLAGLTGGVAGGAPLSTQLTGSGVGNNGALRGPDGMNAIYAGNIILSGPAQISPGFSSSLTLTGTITGSNSSTLVLTPNSNSTSSLCSITLAPPLSAPNTYAGETDIIGGKNSLVGFTVTTANSGAISPASGLNFNGGSGPATLDVAGNNLSVTYLTGAGPGGSALTNSVNSTTSIVTISNGSNSAGLSQSFSTPITGNISVIKAGAGYQTLTAANTFTGGLNITAGTLAVPTSSALGANAVQLSGGKLVLSAPSNISGFGSMAVGGSATISSGTVTLNPFSQSFGSIFTTSPITVSDTNGFTTSFVYYPSPEGSNYTHGGMAFNIINTNSVTGGLVGNGTSWNGVAIDFSLDYTGNGTYTGLQVNGNQSVTNSYGIAPWNVADTGLAGGPITVTLTYANDTITETLVCPNPGSAAGVNTTPATSVTFTYSGVDIASDLGATGGSAPAYIGFTGANYYGTNSTTSYNALQQISGFNFSGGGTVPVPVNSNNPIIALAGTSSTLSVSTLTGNNTEFLQGGLTIQSGAKLAVTEVAGSSGRLVLSTPSLSIASSNGSYQGQLDIQGNDLDLPGATYNTVWAMLKQGYNGGSWTGNGIVSSTAASDSTHLTTLGIITNDNGNDTPLYGTNGTIATTFDGSTPTDGDILVKYTYYGDANLDGHVDGSDYSAIDFAFLNNQNTSNSALTGWANGDFNYDGVIDGSDYTLIDNAFNQQGASINAEVATETAQIAGGSAAVPEPTSLAVVGVASVGMLRRRRRRM